MAVDPLEHVCRVEGAPKGAIDEFDEGVGGLRDRIRREGQRVPSTSHLPSQRRTEFLKDLCALVGYAGVNRTRQITYWAREFNKLGRTGNSWIQAHAVGFEFRHHRVKSHNEPKGGTAGQGLHACNLCPLVWGQDFDAPIGRSSDGKQVAQASPNSHGKHLAVPLESFDHPISACSSQEASHKPSVIGSRSATQPAGESTVAAVIDLKASQVE